MALLLGLRAGGVRDPGTDGGMAPTGSEGTGSADGRREPDAHDARRLPRAPLGQGTGAQTGGLGAGLGEAHLRAIHVPSGHDRSARAPVLFVLQPLTQDRRLGQAPGGHPPRPPPGPLAAFRGGTPAPGEGSGSCSPRTACPCCPSRRGRRGRSRRSPVRMKPARAQVVYPLVERSTSTSRSSVTCFRRRRSPAAAPAPCGFASPRAAPPIGVCRTCCGPSAMWSPCRSRRPVPQRKPSSATAAPGRLSVSSRATAEQARDRTMGTSWVDPDKLPRSGPPTPRGITASACSGSRDRRPAQAGSAWRVRSRPTASTAAAQTRRGPRFRVASREVRNPLRVLLR